MTSLTLVIGGARSGKSRYAESLVTVRPAPWIYVATAEPHDAEMQDRISDHQARRGEGWTTVDAPYELAAAIRAAPAAPLLVDCLTLWLSNMMLGDRDLVGEIDAVEAAVSARQAPTVLVTNEVGHGIVPDNALARAFRDEQGRLNQRIAAIAGTVVFMVAGLPMTVKGAK